MSKGKVTPWNKIKAEYLQGVTPKQLAKKYGLTPKQVSNKANAEKWTCQNRQIKEKIRQNAQEQIKELTLLALKRLEEILSDEELKPSDHIAAAKAVLDISGLKNSKPEEKSDLPIININGIKI